MAETITYNFLWEVLQKERSSNALQLLPKNFYSDIGEFIEGTKNEIAKNEEAGIQIANIERLVSEIFDKRKQKVALYVAYKKPLPNPITDIETDLYNKMMELYINTKIAGPKETKTQQNRLRVIIEKLPEVFLPSGSKIGPLEKGQLIEVQDKNDSKFLIDNSLCVYEKL
ncbi:DNA replication complex GINS family protein [Candidatus Marsarchaeota archaeon]|nr:DNA replication complex GINS family protein [Candidatus Marsarchaeota archaeon]